MRRVAALAAVAALLAVVCVAVVSLGGSEDEVALEEAPLSPNELLQDKAAPNNNFRSQLAKRFSEALRPRVLLQEVQQAAQAVASQEMQHAQWRADAVATAKRASSIASQANSRSVELAARGLSGRVSQAVNTVTEAGQQLRARVRHKLSDAEAAEHHLISHAQRSALRRREQRIQQSREAVLRKQLRRLGRQMELMKVAHSREVQQIRAESADAITSARQQSHKAAETLSSAKQSTQQLARTAKNAVLMQQKITSQAKAREHDLKARLESMRRRHQRRLRVLHRRFDAAKKSSMRLASVMVETAKADAQAKMEAKVRKMKFATHQKELKMAKDAKAALDSKVQEMTAAALDKEKKMARDAKTALAAKLRKLKAATAEEELKMTKDAQAAMKVKVQATKLAEEQKRLKHQKDDTAVLDKEMTQLALTKQKVSSLTQSLATATRKQLQQLTARKRIRKQLVMARKKIHALTKKSRALLYIGCFSDRPTARDLEFLAGSATSPQKCAHMCSSVSATYKYFAMQHGNHCFCGTAFGRYGTEPQDTCFLHCSDNGAMRCGGINRNSIYQLQ